MSSAFLAPLSAFLPRCSRIRAERLLGQSIKASCVPRLTEMCALWRSLVKRSAEDRSSQRLPADVFTLFSAPPLDSAEVGRGGRHTCGSFVQNTAALFGPDGVTAVFLLCNHEFGDTVAALEPSLASVFRWQILSSVGRTWFSHSGHRLFVANVSRP